LSAAVVGAKPVDEIKTSQLNARDTKTERTFVCVGAKIGENEGIA